MTWLLVRIAPAEVSTMPVPAAVPPWRPPGVAGVRPRIGARIGASRGAGGCRRRRNPDGRGGRTGLRRRGLRGGKRERALSFNAASMEAHGVRFSVLVTGQNPDRARGARTPG